MSPVRSVTYVSSRTQFRIIPKQLIATNVPKSVPASLPAPGDVLAAALRMAASGELFRHIAVSTARCPHCGRKERSATEKDALYYLLYDAAANSLLCHSPFQALAFGNGKCQPGSGDKVVSDISARCIYDIFDRYCLERYPPR
jgi:hypothetical protein